MSYAKQKTDKDHSRIVYISLIGPGRHPVLWPQISKEPDPDHCTGKKGTILLAKNVDMKKILVAFDGAHFPSSTLDFALEMNSEEPIVLTGIFVPSTDYAEAMSYYYYGNAIASLYREEYEEDAATIATNIALFENFCKEHHIRYKVH